MACWRGSDEIPSYFQLFVGILNFTANAVRDNYFVGPEVGTKYKSWRCINFTVNDMLVVFLLSAAFTVLRHLASKWIFKPLAVYFLLTPANQKKMPESAWKFLFYISIWCYAFYVLILSGNYCYFQKPSTVWDDWNLNKEAPLDIYLLYALESGFYVHSLYATLFLDVWRKDSVVMMVHHLLTLTLISISHSLRYHNIGCLIIFLHDICDIQLEFTKLNVYLKTQNGQHVRKHEILANTTFFCFAITWFISRLYYYPLKVLYATTTIVSQTNIDLPCATLMNCLLWLLQAMNVYWFLFIIGLLLRVATGQIKEVDDTREYDVEEKFFHKLSAKLDSVSGTLNDTSDEKKHSDGKNSTTNGESNTPLTTQVRKRF